MPLPGLAVLEEDSVGYLEVPLRHLRTVVKYTVRVASQNGCLRDINLAIISMQVIIIAMCRDEIV